MKQLRFFFILMAWVCIHTAWGQVSTSSDPLYGKRIGVIGDSYVRNHREPVEYTWHYKFAKKHRMQYFNYGRNGNCVAMPRARFGEAMYKRYKEMTDSLDYVVVIAGHNDASLLDSIGIDNYKEKLGILCNSNNMYMKKSLKQVKYPCFRDSFFSVLNDIERMREKHFHAN